jgi:hypothetical protein
MPMPAKNKNAASQQIDAILSKGGKKKKGKKARKLGRYSRHPSSVRYRSEHRWVSNKLRRMARHIKYYPADAQAKALYAIAENA